MPGDPGFDFNQMLKTLEAVKKGDFSVRLELPCSGIQGKVVKTLNEIIGMNGRLSEELDAVNLAVVEEGNFNHRASLTRTTGAWRVNLNSLNNTINFLVQSINEISRVFRAVARGDLQQKMSLELHGKSLRGTFLKTAEIVNVMVEQLNAFASEVTRVVREVGTEGKLGGQAMVRGASGIWKELTDHVNIMAGNLTSQVRSIAEVTTAVAEGNLTKKIRVEARGEILVLKNIINRMVEQLRSFASEVTRVAREVGTEGKLGGQAEIEDISGIWRTLSNNVNIMANNLTEQVRNIAEITTAVAGGDLSKKIDVPARGEISQLKNTVNMMVDQLGVIASEVMRVAREVGTEGKLGGQADIEGISGIWRKLTDNVNTLANNLTNQVRAIGIVVTAVTQGDLTREITVEAKGEVLELRNNVNEMIATLKKTTIQNQEQDWLKTNLAKFAALLQGGKDLRQAAELVLSELAPVVGGQHAAFYYRELHADEPVFGLLAGYAYMERKHLSKEFRLREGLVGQCAFEGKRILITNVPADYVRITSGLGEAEPLNLVVLPIVFQEQVIAVIELSSFSPFSEIKLSFLDQLMENLGIVFNSIAAMMQTDKLLKRSQSLTDELRQQQEELQQTNEELEEKASQLYEQNKEVAKRKFEVEEAKAALEEKARQLELTSRYKSEFLANMSHELRTPLNSLMIFADLLSRNNEGNLSEKQVKFVQDIYSSGAELLNLINDILNLARIESGSTTIEAAPVSFTSLKTHLERNFRAVAQKQQLAFSVEFSPELPESLETDRKRLQQVLKNLLSNAFKFTKEGGVIVSIKPAAEGWRIGHEVLDRAELVLVFSVKDTGIGIPADKQSIIFEAFQQADGSTSRKYGGTGLGLSISREIVYLLGGDILVESTPGKGSEFIIYLPNKINPAGNLPAAGSAVLPKFFNSHREEKTFPPQKSSLPGRTQTVVEDDLGNIRPEDRVLLIIEDDVKFATVLVKFSREKGFKALVAMEGELGLKMARQHKPDAITLDIVLPDIGGWAVLDRLKHDPGTRHIPVHIISVTEELQRGLKMGAVAFLLKPVEIKTLKEAMERLFQFINRDSRNLLLVEDDEKERQSLCVFLGGEGVVINSVGTGKEALSALKAENYDCMVLDLGLPDINGLDLIIKIKDELNLDKLPIIIYTGRELTEEEEVRLRKIAETIIIKDVKSPERLLDETSLFLHRVQTNLPIHKQEPRRLAYQDDPMLKGKKVLIVDDDLRTVFAVTSALEPFEMEILHAENGKQGLEQLLAKPEIDIVLMDIMMPEMDGYEAMREIRKHPEFKRLPVISLTAKAMKSDRDECIKAGASDYISKPLNIDQLISLMRVWLFK